MRFWRRRTVMGRYCRLLVVLILCTIVVSIFLKARLSGLGQGASASGGKTGGMFGGKSRLGLFAKERKGIVDLFEKEFKGKDLMPPSVESMEEKKQKHTGDALLDYYLTMYVDGKDITWHSDVNDKTVLMEAMKEHLTMMLEANVQVSWNDVTKKTNGTAVIASKPNLPYDITLSDWLTIVARFSYKGVKLNFASAEAAMYGAPILSSLAGVLHAPVWLHADILPGPNGNSVPPIDHKAFFKMASSGLLPKVTLSLGWTTAWNPDPVDNRYAWSSVISMARLCALVKAPISFSVRAVYAAKSTRQLNWLLSLARRFTVTVWADKYDIVSMAELVYFRQKMEGKRVFFNLPSSMTFGLKDIAANSLSESATTDGPAWNRNNWEPVLIHDNSLAFLGKEQAVLDGPGSWLLSKVPYKAEMKKTKTVVVSGMVQFVDTDPASPPEDAHLDVFIRNAGVNPPAPDDVQGVRLRIRQDGALTLSPVNLNQAGIFKVQSTAHLPRSDCFRFQLVDKGDGYPLHCTVKTRPTCKDMDDAETDTIPVKVDLHLNIAYEPDKQLFYVAVNGGSVKNSVVLDRLSVDDKAWG